MDKNPHPHMVHLGVSGEAELSELFERLKEKGVPCVAWYEDDMDDQLTAVATVPLEKKARRAFRQLQLLS